MFLQTKVKKILAVVPSSTQGLRANLSWYLQRHSCSCHVVNPWFQPFLVLQAVGKTIAYPLYEMCNSLVSLGEVESNCPSDVMVEILLRLWSLETQPEKLYHQVIFNL